jgi:hypothetical protein
MKKLFVLMLVMISFNAMAFGVFHPYHPIRILRYMTTPIYHSPSRAPTRPVEEEPQLKSTVTELMDYVNDVRKGYQKGSFKKFERLWVKTVGPAKTYDELRRFMNLAQKLGMKR